MVVMTTVPDALVAGSIATRLLEENLVACVNILPGVLSLYRWQGEIRRDSEVLLLAKTTSAVVANLSERIVELHPYDLPEVLALPAPAGSVEYFDWVRGEVGSVA